MCVLLLLGEFGPGLLALAILIIGLVVGGVIGYRLNKSWKHRPK